jgi:4-hydroxybenzoate polyprenyltransferase
MKLLRPIIEFIFFGNYFVGILGIVLSIETAVQLRIPFNSAIYYLLLFCGTVMYYTYAYASGALQSFSTDNPRALWYRKHHIFAISSQWLLLGICVILSGIIFTRDFTDILRLPWLYWAVVGVILLASVLYYGLLPKSIFTLNLRNTGWLKAFVIGFVWAGSVSLLPIVVLRIDGVPYHLDIILTIGLFIKNWMFCTVNAIMFDMKDYADDSNRQLKTFVVRFGIRRTIFFILIPLSLIGIASMLAFTHYRHFTALPVLINLIPFLLLILVSYSMHRQKGIFYYLIVIDGLVLVKGLCGILAMHFVHY